MSPLDEMVQMRGHNIWFQIEIRKIIPQLSSDTTSYLQLLSCYGKLMVNGYTFRESNIVIFNFPPINDSQLLEEKEKILSYESNFIFVKISLLREINMTSQELSPCYRMEKKCVGIPIHQNMNVFGNICYGR